MSDNDCLFCKMVRQEVPVQLLHEDDQVVAFRDINPQAPTHLLIVPRKHITDTNALDASDGPALVAMMTAAQQLARREGIADSGYRLIFNCNNDGGQSVYHIHLHLLGGRRMSWPPG